MVTFKKLVVENMFSYGKAQVQFEPGLFLLEGNNLDRDSCSNMAGKSALWDSLSTIIWEDNSRGQVKDEVVNKSKKRSEGIVLVERDGVDIEVGYARGSDKRWWLKKNGVVEEYSWDNQKKKVIEAVGMSYSEFVLSSWFQQGIADSFLLRNDAERKELFIKWLGLGMFQELRDKVKGKRKEIEITLAEKMKIKELEEKVKQLGIAKEDLDRAFAVLSKWKNTLPVSVDEYRRKRAEALKQLKDWREAKRLEGIIASGRKTRDELAGQVKNLKERTLHLKDGKCWVCGSSVDTDTMLKEINDKLVELKDMLNNMESYLQTWERVYIRGKGINRERVVRDMVELRSRLGDVDEYRWAVQIKGRIEEQKRMNEMVTVVDSSEIDSLSWEIETAKKWEKGLGDDGVVSYILDKVLVVFNEMMRKYGEVLGIFVEFQIGKRGQLEIKVSDGYKTLTNVNWWSGSEKYSVALVIMLGLSEFLSYQGKGTNLLIMDEIFAPFDIIGREKILELLKWLKNSGKTVVVVTHHEDIKRQDIWNGVWVVDKKDGISNLRMM
jgi:DNA repair exonuclease SbcCD ATPase subunit